MGALTPLLERRAVACAARMHAVFACVVMLAAGACSAASQPDPDPAAMLAGDGDAPQGAGANDATNAGGSAQPASGGADGVAPGRGVGDGVGAPPATGDAGLGAGDPDAASSDDTSPALRGTGPGDWSAGDYPPALMDPAAVLEISGVAGQAGNVRQYKVHVPPGYDPEVPTPAVFCIHGLAQDPIMFCVVGADWVSTADAGGFILIMPFGFQNSWNAGTCCGGASTAQLDDVALFRAILDEVGTHVNIDLDRVYATGLSNGGYMSYRLACEAADILAAVAPGAGAVGKNDIGGGTNPASDFTVCEPSRPISVLDVHGTADGLVPYTLQAPSLSHMAAAAGCGATTATATDPAGGGDTTCVSFEGCSDGLEIIGCTVEGGGHCWFGSEDCGTGGGAFGAAIVGANSDTMRNNEAIWRFFQRHRLP